MLPRIASLGQLSSALSRNGFAPKGKQVQGRRSSIERRSCSVQDLVGLDVDQVAASSRPVTPCPLGAITEGFSLVESAAAADDTLAYLDSLQQATTSADANADLSVHLQICSPWEAVAHAQSESAPAGAELHLLASSSAAPEPAFKPVPAAAPVQVPALAAVEEQQQLVAAPATPPAHEHILSHSITLSRASSISSSTSTLPPATPSAEPAPGEVRLYRTHLSLTYVKELLNNLAHVQTLMRTAASQGTQAAATTAAGAARMISRSLTRVATRVRNSAKGGAGEVLMSPEALFTLTEYGWAEVTTLDAGCAEELQVVEMECYDLVLGRSVLYTRVSADQPWLQVGYGSTSIGSVLQALGGVVHPALLAAVNALGGQGDVLRPALGRAAAAGRGANGYPPTLAHLADQLVSAGEAVMDAAMHLDQWIKEVVVSGAGSNNSDGGVPATPLAAGGAGTAAFSAPAHNNNTGLAVAPIMVTAGGV